jgi:hypothetical protein
MKLSMFFKKPAKKVFFKKKEEPKIHTTLEFINNLDRPRKYKNPVRGFKPLVFQNVFQYINLNKEGNRIPEHIISNLPYKKYGKVYPIPETPLHENKEISRLLNIYQFLYDNGGIYLNKPIKTHPSLFIKNHEMIVVNIDLFSCEKNSPIIKSVLDDAIEIAKTSDINEMFQSFYRLTENAFHFNSSIRFLV